MTAEIRASDTCDPDPEVTVISIVRNAPAAGEGGRAPEDIQGTRLLRDDTALEPQAVPFWEDRGQLHTVTYQITDCAGNTTKASTEVVMEYSREGAPSGEDVADGIAPLPESLIIGAIHPNPSNASTQIDFSLPASGNTRLEIFDIQGRRVATLVDGELPAGHHHAGWSGRDDRGDRLALGVYLVRLNHNGGTVVKKLVRIE